jgi:hypothetical protein
VILVPFLAASAIGCSSAFLPPAGWPGLSPSDVSVGPLLFTGLRGYETWLPPAQPDGWYFAKSPTGLRKAHTVTLQIDARDRGWARFDYGDRTKKAGAVTFSSCRGETAPRWTGWAGGFTVAHAGCAHFTAVVDGAPPKRYRVGLGQVCA